jgi:hypothetical protein
MIGRRTCFLICPISKQGDATNQRSRRLLGEIVKPAVEKFGFRVEHFLDPIYTEGYESIREAMFQFLKTADVCIADLTGSNPNVFFEYGLRRSTGRPVLAFIRSGETLQFDVSDYHTPPYDFEKPEDARHAIEEFLAQKGFELPLVHVRAERGSQSEQVVEFILREGARRVNVLHFSLLAISNPLFDACYRVEDLTVAILLMHPECAKKYAGGEMHADNIRKTEEAVKRAPDTARVYRYKNPTIGLWYYRHEPSVAGLMVDDKLVQLGWYFREPDVETDKLRLWGHNEPSLIAEGEIARELIAKFRPHFEQVWRKAERVCLVGPRQEELTAEWERVKAGKNHA